MTVELYFMINLHERMLPTQQGSNPQPPGHQSDPHPTELPRTAGDTRHKWVDVQKFQTFYSMLFGA